VKPKFHKEPVYKNREEAEKAGWAIGYEEGRLQGHAEGHEEGHAEGHAAGRAEALSEMAKKMLASGMSVEQVCGFTGLDPADVEPLNIG